MLDLIEALEELEERYERQGWSEADFQKYWFISHKMHNVAPKLVPNNYKTKAILKKFLSYSDKDLPSVVTFAVTNHETLRNIIPRYDCGIVSFCFNYPEIKHLAFSKTNLSNERGVY